MTSAPASASKRGWWVPFAFGAAAIALALAALVVEIPDLHWWATSLQLVGAFIASVGFLSAYVRADRGLSLWQQFRLWAKQFRAWVRRWWDRLRGKSRDVVINAPSAGAVAGMFAPTVTVSGVVLVDPSAPLDQQVARLVDFANAAAKRLSELEKHVGRLDNRIDKAVADAAQGMADTLAHIEMQIDQLKARLDRAQVLDLRWAIAGLFITVVGTALSY